MLLFLGLLFISSLNEIKELIAKIAKEKSLEKKNELCDKLA
jgi:hypothetical protein